MSGVHLSAVSARETSGPVTARQPADVSPLQPRTARPVPTKAARTRGGAAGRAEGDMSGLLRGYRVDSSKTHKQAVFVSFKEKKKNKEMH